MFSYEWSRKVINATANTLFSASVPVTPEHVIERPDHTLDEEELAKAWVSIVLAAISDNPRWTSVQVTLPNTEQTTVEAQIDTGTGGEPTRRQTLTYDFATGTLVSRTRFSDTEPA